MFKKKELTRLGDILVSKGLISPEQLASAIQEQSKRKLLLDPTDANAKVTPIGEILIELGFIDQLQLKRGLNWQQRLRHASIAMALCAPFMIFSPSAAASVVRPAPITIEAENYSAMSGVFNETTSDVGGGRNTAGINTGDWMTYNGIAIPAAGTYKITYRVASLNSGGLLQLKSGNGTTFESVNVPATGGWQTWVDIEQVVTLSEGAQNLTLLAISGGFNINWIKIENLNLTASSSSVSSSVATFPAISIEAEKYSTMSGVFNETTSDVGGGQNAGGINTGDWMTYSGIAIPAAGTYKITYRVASLNAGGAFQLKSGTGAVIDAVSVPVTGGWQKWVDVERTVTLSAGTNNLTLLATGGGFNINWFKIENISATVSSSSASSVASSAASSVTSSVISSEGSSLALGAVVIQAETYSARSGVFNESTSDVGGGQNTGGIDTGDWMNYSNTKVQLPFTGKYKITYRVASLNGGGSLALNEEGTNTTYHTVSIPKTSGWQNWVDVSEVVDLTAGDHYFSILGKVGGFNINWFKIEPVGTIMPLTIQAEDYSAMKGIFTETTSDTGGGKNVGGINTGGGMDYKNVEVLIPATATYKVTYRVASLSAGGSFTFHEAGGSAIFDTVPVPVTGGWQKWISVERMVTLPAGKHYFGIKALVGGFNLNWIKVEAVDQAGNPVSPPPVGSTTSSSNSSSAPAVSSSSSSKPAVSSSSWSSSSSAANTQHVAGPVGISWTAPNKRENGEYLDVTDLGGYEVRYKKSSDSKFTYISINDAWTTSYNFPWLEGDYVFQIAAFDKNGVYSSFVDILRQ